VTAFLLRYKCVDSYPTYTFLQIRLHSTSNITYGGDPMELLRILAWISVGWLAAAFLCRRHTRQGFPDPRAQPVAQPLPEPLRPRLLENQSMVLDDSSKQRLATMCLRDGKSLIYIAVCPWHKATADANSSGRCFSWDVETGMAHCFWCGWGGRVARPLSGPVHPDLLPSTFRLVLVT
jgi:hypothetical protein